MTQRNKLIERIKGNPKDVRFEDACKVAEWLGFEASGGKGSHRVFHRKGEPSSLNFQDRNGRITPYQARQLIVMIDTYYDRNTNGDE